MEAIIALILIAAKLVADWNMSKKALEESKKLREAMCVKITDHEDRIVKLESAPSHRKSQ